MTKIIIEFTSEADAETSVQNLVNDIRAGNLLEFAIVADDGAKIVFQYCTVRYAAPFRFYQSEKSQDFALN